MQAKLQVFQVMIIGFLLATVTFSCAIKKNSGRNTSNPNEISILSYNIHHANPPSKPDLIDIDAICNVIKDADVDIVALQEVDVHTHRSGNVDQAAAIAKKLGLNYHFFKAIDHEGGEYGLAIMSKFPIREPQTHRLPQVEKAEERILAMLQVQVGKQWVYVANTHLDATRSHSNRIKQMQHIGEIASKTDIPMIICGDFNATPESETIRILDTHFKRTCVEDCQLTVPQINPRRTIDYIATKNIPWQQQSIETIQETYASDHLPVKVVFKRD